MSAQQSIADANCVRRRFEDLSLLGERDRAQAAIIAAISSLQVATIAKRMCGRRRSRARRGVRAQPPTENRAIGVGAQDAYRRPQMSVSAIAEPTRDTVELLYYRPLGPFHDYEIRLARIAHHYADRVRLTKLRVADLARLGRTGAFISPTRPTMALVRGGAVVAQAIGDLSSREIDLLVRGAVAG
jgi:hypothetical protein